MGLMAWEGLHFLKIILSFYFLVIFVYLYTSINCIVSWLNVARNSANCLPSPLYHTYCPSPAFHGLSIAN